MRRNIASRIARPFRFARRVAESRALSGRELRSPGICRMTFIILRQIDTTNIRPTSFRAKTNPCSSGPGMDKKKC